MTGRAATVLAMAAVSCTQVSDRDRFEGNDAPLRLLQTVPTAGAVDVSPTARIELCLSAEVDPRSVEDGDAAVGSGPALIDTELQLQLVAWTAPGGGPVPEGSEAPWCLGSVVSAIPGQALTPGARYRLHLEPGLRGWAGGEIDTEGPGWFSPEGGGDPRLSLEFTVGEDDGAPEPEPEPGPTLTELFSDGGPFDPARGNCSCHRDRDALAFARLDLTDATTAYAGLALRTDPKETGFAMVVPRDASQSYLLHKLLRDDAGESLYGILGDAMPPTGPLPYADLVAIARWIEAGAPP